MLILIKHKYLLNPVALIPADTHEVHLGEENNKSEPRTRWRDYVLYLARSRLGVEPAQLSEIAQNREVFPVFLGLLPPQPSWEEKRARKWMN